MTDDSAKPAAAAPKGGPLAGIDAQREAAKWLVAALAAVAGVLVAGSQLSSIGEVTGWRLVLAVASAVAGLGAVGLALRETFRLLRPSSLSLEELADLPWPKSPDPAIKYLVSNPSVFLGRAKDPSNLKTRLEEALNAEDKAVAAAQDAEKEEKKALEEAANEAIAMRVGLEEARRSVIEHARYAHVSDRSDRWERVIIGSLLAAGLAIVLFAWAANPPDDDQDAGNAQNLRAIRLVGLDLSGRDLSGLDFSRSTFVRVKLLGAITEGADFSDVTWQSVTCVDGRNSDDLGETCEGHLGQ